MYSLKILNEEKVGICPCCKCPEKSIFLVRRIWRSGYLGLASFSPLSSRFVRCAAFWPQSSTEYMTNALASQAVPSDIQSMPEMPIPERAMSLAFCHM
jgi:hypothetical protein